MIRIEKSIVIDAPVEQVFAYLVDPAHLPEYLPGTDVVKDIRRLPDGRSTCTIVSKFLGLHVEFKDEQIDVIPNERIVERSHGGGMEWTATTHFERLEGGKTRTSELDEATIHGGPLGKLGQTFFARYLEHGMEMAMLAGKAHIEAEARTATPS